MNERTLDEILHSIVILGISAAAIFVKNPNSRQHAGQIIDLVQTEVLPLADGLLNPPAPLPIAAAPALVPATA